MDKLRDQLLFRNRSRRTRMVQVRRILLVMLGMLFVLPGVLLAVTNTMAQIRGLIGGGAETGNLQLAPDTALSQSDQTTTQVAGIIPADRTTTWNPGLNAVGGI